MKVTKKLLSLALILMVVVSTMVLVPLTANATDCDTSSMAGSGTEADPWIIATKADLLALGTISAELSGPESKVYLELAGDIDMTGVNAPEGTEKFYSIKMKSGNQLHFDGKGYAIKNLEIHDNIATGAGGQWVGLFGLVRSGSSIKNLKMVNVDVTDGGLDANIRVAVVVGLANAPFTMENCFIDEDCSVTTTVAQRVAGFVGDFDGTGALTFENCVNNAPISAGNAARAAGFVSGINQTPVDLTVINCVNNGDVTANGDYVGGMLGFHEPEGTTASTWTFTNCVNNGDMNGKSDTSSTGGFISCVWGNPISATYENCLNTGTITGKNAGGLFGYYETMNGTSATVIKNFGNTGTITDGSRVGGLAGKFGANKNNGESTILLENCYNTHNSLLIKEQNNATDQYAEGGFVYKNCASAGGLVGSVLDNGITVFDGCSNKEYTESEINAVKALAYTPDISVLEIRLKLTDDFGLMAIAAMPVDEEVGFYFSTDAETLISEENRVEGAYYGDGKTYATYTALTAAELGTPIYFAAYVVVDGVEYVSAARDINCAELAEDLADGYLGDAATGTLVTENGAEKTLYAAMFAYYEKYSAYLASVTLPA